MISVSVKQYLPLMTCSSKSSCSASNTTAFIVSLKALSRCLWRLFLTQTSLLQPLGGQNRELSSTLESSYAALLSIHHQLLSLTESLAMLCQRVESQLMNFPSRLSKISRLQQPTHDDDWLLTLLF